MHFKESLPVVADAFTTIDTVTGMSLDHKKSAIQLFFCSNLAPLLPWSSTLALDHGGRTRPWLRETEKRAQIAPPRATLAEDGVQHSVVDSMLPYKSLSTWQLNTLLPLLHYTPRLLCRTRCTSTHDCTCKRVCGIRTCVRERDTRGGLCRFSRCWTRSCRSSVILLRFRQSDLLQMKPAETMTMVEFEQPISAESIPPVNSSGARDDSRCRSA